MAKTKLTIPQLKELLEKGKNASAKTFSALKDFLQAELERRKVSGKKGGRPITATGEKAKKHREYMRLKRKAERAELNEGLNK